MTPIAYCRRNAMLISLLFLVSLMFGVPHIMNISRITYELYNPFPVQNGLGLNMDENLFAPGFQDAADGHFIVRNPQLKEYKNEPSHLDIFPFLIIGLAAHLFSAGAREIFIVADFIFPPLVLLLFYLVARRIFSLEKKLAILVALLVLLFQSFTGFIREIITFNLGYFNFFSAIDFLGYSKLYAPEFIAIPFLVALIALYEAFRRDDMRLSIFASLSGALLFYTYIYYSTFFWATCLILSFFELRQKGAKAVKKILIILVPAAILAIPYALNFVALSRSEAYRDTLLRAGLETSRFIPLPLIYAAISAVFLIAAYYVINKRNKFLFSFAAVMLLAASILMNLQIITGYSVQPWHWEYRVLEFLYFFLAAYIIQEGLEIMPKNHQGIVSVLYSVARKLFYFLVHPIAVTGLIVVFIIYGFGFNISAANATTEIYTLTEGEADLYKWLDKNTPADSTVMALSVKESLQIPSFTHNNVYLPDGLTSGRTTEELVDRFVFAHALYNASRALEEKLSLGNDALRLEYINRLYKGARFSLYDFEKYYFINYFFHAQFFFGRWDHQQKNPDIPGALGFYFPVSFREHVMQKLQSQSYNIYDFEYIVVGPYERVAGNISSIENNFTKVYSNGEFEVFVIKN